MSIRIYHIDDDPGGGGGDDPKAPVVPKGYKGALPVQTRNDWNGFLDYLDKKGVGGSKDLDKKDQSLGLGYLKQYNKENPNSTLTPDIIPQIQYEQYMLRKGDAFPGLSSEQLKYVRNGLSPAYMQRPVSEQDGWIGSLTSKQYYPIASRASGESKYNFGTDMESYVKGLTDPSVNEKFLQPPVAAAGGAQGAPTQPHLSGGGVKSASRVNLGTIAAMPSDTQPATSAGEIGGNTTNIGLAPVAGPAAAINAPAPGVPPTLPITGPAAPANSGGAPGGSAPSANANLIPRPDYNDQASRNNFLKQWGKKYGDLQGRGDTILKLNEVPRGGHSTEEEIATNAAKKYGIDPALLHVSAFEEGASELFKDKSGLDTKHRKPTDFGYMGDYGDKEFPINGDNSFGLPDFTKRFPDLVAGGYLPKNFQSQFRGTKRAGEFGENNFKSVEDAMTAKAALMKYGADYVEKQAQKNGVELSPKQKDFFMLAWFNGGEGAVLNRLPQYKAKGYLKDDSFLDKRPKEEMGKPDNLDVWGHVVPRIKRRDALVEQQFFQQKP